MMSNPQVWYLPIGAVLTALLMVMEIRHQAPVIPVRWFKQRQFALSSFITVLVNLVMLGWLDQDLGHLAAYCRLAVEVTRSEMPRNYPVVGEDAFATSTGVHAAAVAKAYQKGDNWLADRVYSSVPAALVGRRQAIKVGPMSGRSNAEFWLRDHGVEPTHERLDAVMGAAKATDHVLTDEEILTTIGRLERSASV